MTRDPVLVFAATVTLAVSIAANTTLFSVANSIVLRPLSYPDAARIDWISERSGPARDETGTLPDYYRIRENNRVFDEVAAFNQMTVNRTGIDTSEQLDAATVSASFFRVMGMQPVLGRYLAPAEEGTHSPPVVVMSYAFWRNRTGSDPHIAGKTIVIDRLPRTVIGVMPQGFDYPRGTQLWMPLRLDESSERAIVATKPIFTVSMVARRKAHVTQKEVDADLTRLSYGIREEYKVFPTKFRWDLSISAGGLQQHSTGPVRPALAVLSGAAALVLLIACVNLANLLVARAGNRSRELAVRLALGASRCRVARQMLGESVALAAPGGLAGMGFSWVAVQLLNAAKPAFLLRYPPVIMDWLALAFTSGLTFAAAMLFGIAPALSATGIEVYETLKSAAASHSGGVGAARLRKLLVAAELAVSLVLLIGAGLLARTFVKLSRVELGFRSDHLLTFRVTPIGPFDRDYSAFFRAVLERLQQLPAVHSAAVLTDVPLSDGDFYMGGRIRVAGRPMIPFPERPVVNNTTVSPEFFATMGIPLRSGRVFSRHDRPATFVTNYGMATAVPVLVNEALARRIFPGEDPVGRNLIFGPDKNPAEWTIVGVVGDIRGGVLGADPPPMVYRCLCDGSHVMRAAFALRTYGDPHTAVRAAAEQVHAVDRDLPLFDVKTMDERRAAAIAPEQFQLAVIGSFAAIAILLAVAGVYGVVSYLAARRTREIGIRVAVGARPADVIGMVASETMLPALAGTAAGLGGAWALTRYLRSMLYGVTELDAATFCLAAVLLLAVVLIASLAPARFAARLDPLQALREE